MEYAERAPDRRLAGIVRRYCGYAEDEPAPVRRREVPSARVVVILGLGPALHVDGEERSSFVAALDDKPSTTEHAGVSSGIQIDLSPPGARRLLGVPMHELSTRVVPLSDVLGHSADLLVERLAETPGWQARFALLEAALARRIAGARPATPEVEWAWRALERTGGRFPVASLAERTGWSARRLIARFRDEIGMPPKLAARIVRFERAVGRMGDGDGWAEIAYECGYYDQAHLNRDFRQFAHTTPAAFAAERAGDYLSV